MADLRREKKEGRKDEFCSLFNEGLDAQTNSAIAPITKE